MCKVSEVEKFLLNKDITVEGRTVLCKNTLIKGIKRPEYIEVYDIVDGLIDLTDFLELCAEHGDLIDDDDLTPID